VLFFWVIPREDLSGYIVKKMREHDLSFELKKITLMCTDDQLKERMRLDGRDTNTIEKSIVYQDAFRLMNTIKVDTSGLTVLEIIDELLKII
jgi:hypothetical protein